MDKMTLEALRFTARVQIGSRIRCSHKQVMIVTRITDTAIWGNNEYCLEKWGKEQEMALTFKTIMNPHYGVKGLEILE